MTKLTFRFDVDTHRCAERGVPALLELASEFGVPFTFFVNPGKAVNRMDYIRELVKTRNPSSQGESLSAFRKLGLRDFLIVSFMNPRITSYASSLKQIDIKSHEVGLHGGTNHQSWARHADQWSKQKLRDEISMGKNELEKLFPNLVIEGFASPGFNSPSFLDEILYEQKFTYCADSNSSNGMAFQDLDQRKLAYPKTNLFGAPSGIATVEHLTAIGKNRKEIVSHILSRVTGETKKLIIYDHPYFAGIEALDVFRDLLENTLSLGIEIQTMKDQAFA